MSFEDAIRKDAAAGGPWATRKPTHTNDEAVKALALAMGLSAIQIKAGAAGSAEDRARIVAGELELLGFSIQADR
jgi:hypothetical protein